MEEKNCHFSSFCPKSSLKTLFFQGVQFPLPLQKPVFPRGRGNSVTYTPLTIGEEELHGSMRIRLTCICWTLGRLLKLQRVPSTIFLILLDNNLLWHILANLGNFIDFFAKEIVNKFSNFFFT